MSVAPTITPRTAPAQITRRMALPALLALIATLAAISLPAGPGLRQ